MHRFPGHCNPFNGLRTKFQTAKRERGGTERAGRNGLWYKNQPMRTRSLALAWTVALMLLLSLAGPGGCGDCFGTSVPGCCAATCSLCPCCAQTPTVLAGMAGMHRDPAPASLSGGSTEGGPLAAHGRDVFHVPKTFLI